MEVSRRRNKISYEGNDYLLPSGSSLTIMNNKVFVDGEEATPIGGVKNETKPRKGIWVSIITLINLRS